MPTRLPTPRAHVTTLNDHLNPHPTSAPSQNPITNQNPNDSTLSLISSFPQFLISSPLRIFVIALATTLTACTIHPKGEFTERDKTNQIAQTAAYTQPFEKRPLPELKPDATPEELVHYALLANGDIEAKYWEWRSMIEEVPMNGTQMTGTELSLETMIMDGNLSLEDITLGIANDAMNSIQFPSKLRADATTALHKAQAAGRRFDAARWQLRNKVLSAWYDYALTAEQLRLEESNTKLLELMARESQTRLAGGMGGSQTELLKSEGEVAMSKNAAAALQGKLPSQRAMLNGMLGRAADAPLNPPTTLPEPRKLAATDADLLAAAAKNNPDLQALAHEAQAGKDAISRAKMEYIPDFNLSFSSDLAGMSQTLMGSVVLPYLRHEGIDAGIRQAEANLHQTQAMQRQLAREQSARILADLAMLRESERQAAILQSDLIPRAQRITEVAQTILATGNGMMGDLLDSQRSVLVLKRMAAEMRIEREKQIADLEEVCGGLPEK